ncbi:hypothetical protein F975_02925 [Acinetobacter sp. ANC 3789]|uniref:putative holin n=1 Tax=Acinetobacter sp. ANC 3789 TaxID=1217714 RepID=UPI0002CF506E|nr:putative holin [Acinetobacter sp. ANC 3789]ENU79233.1 hypothetical protein F975_02925 [Acinetobacter sp. ANC 3789]
MPDPTTTVAITAGAGAVSMLPFVNGDALFGAVIGAAFIAFYTQNVSYQKRIISFLLSTAIGYLLSPEVVNRTLIDSHATGAFMVSLVAIVILQKVLAWLEGASLADVLGILSGKLIDLASIFSKKPKGKD